ncbi:MAG: hypothetical protein NT145_03155 [Elusimicrobia bacterium]|nr:hypothetical protein [Elusimicrobiota bacterium]
MKKSLISKTTAVCLSLFLILGQSLIADYDPNGVKGQITAIYDYSNFGFTGTYNAINNPATNSITRVYANGSVTGHPGLDGAIINNTIFIPQSISYFSANGVVQKTRDLVSNTFQGFDVAGKIVSSYSIVDSLRYDGSMVSLRYDASVVYADNGSYKISRTGSLSNASGVVITYEDVSATPPTGKLTTDPYAFTTSVEEYDPTGKLIQVLTYQLNSLENDSIVGGKVVYTYNGPYLTEVNTYNIQNYQSTDPLNLEKSVHTQIETYAGNVKRTVKKLRREVASPNLDTDYFLAQKYTYDGPKLVKMQDYDETGNNNRITYYDVFSRQSKVEDPVSDKNNKSGVVRLLQEFFYNDTLTNVVSQSYDKTVSVTCIPGGLVKSVNYTYPDEGDYMASDTTYYKNGDQTKAGFAIREENPTGILALFRNKDTGQTFPAATKVFGTLDISGNGLVSLKMTNTDDFVSLGLGGLEDGITYAYGGGILNAIQRAIDEDENYINNAPAEGSRAFSLLKIRDSLLDQWNVKGTAPTSQLWDDHNFPGGRNRTFWTPAQGTAGELDLKVGAINLDNITPPLPDQTAYNVAFNETLYRALANPIYDDKTATLDCSYWAIDSSGNIWVFANAALDEDEFPVHI